MPKLPQNELLFHYTDVDFSGHDNTVRTTIIKKVNENIFLLTFYLSSGKAYILYTYSTKFANIAKILDVSCPKSNICQKLTYSLFLPSTVVINQRQKNMTDNGIWRQKLVYGLQRTKGITENDSLINMLRKTVSSSTAPKIARTSAAVAESNVN